MSPRCLLPWRSLCVALVLATLAGPALGADGPTRPGVGSRPRRSPPATPVPPPRPAGDWTTQVGPRNDPRAAHPPASAPAQGTSPDTPAETPAPAEPQPQPAPQPDRLFDDRPTGADGPVQWAHAPSGDVVSTETYTEEACTRLLGDPSLPDPARASLLGGRARARMRMWRLDGARADIEAALALDSHSAALHLIHAEILACLGRAGGAEEALQQAILLDPASSFVARVLGLIRFQQGSMQSAADALAIHVRHAQRVGTAAGDATLPLLRAVAANEFATLTPADHAGSPWLGQLAAFLTGSISREVLLERARDPRGASADEAACTAWFYLGMRSLARGERDRARLDLLAALRTGCTSQPEYRLAVSELIRLGVLSANSLPGRLAQ